MHLEDFPVNAQNLGVKLKPAFGGSNPVKLELSAFLHTFLSIYTSRAPIHPLILLKRQ